MRPIISFVGKSDSGKTTILEKLITELKKRGHAVVTLKHSGEDIELDRAGKNSWRFAHAGSDIVAVSTRQQTAIMKMNDHDLTPHEIAGMLRWDYDVMLTEGFKKADTPKIEVHRREQGPELLTAPERLLAVVTDEPLNVSVPQLAADEIGKIADVVEEHIKAQSADTDIEVFVNGARAPVTQFVKDWMSGAVQALASNVEGTGEIRSLDISLRRKV